MTNYNDQSPAIPEKDMLDIPQPGANLPVIAPPTTNEMVTMMLRTAGTLEITDEQKKILFAPVDPETVEIRPDGLIYLPAMEYREKLCQAFDVGWALLPAEPKPQREGNLIVWPHYLFIQGQPVALVYGEQEYRPNNYTMTYGDAIEGAASNALMRACKRINVNKELWRPSFIRQWKEQYAEAYIVQEGKNRGKTQWRMKETQAEEEVIEGGAVATEEAAAEPEATQETEQAFDPSDTSFWRRKAMQHAGDLGLSDDEVTHLCQEHFYQYVAADDDSSGDYLRDQSGQRVHVTEKKQLHWTQWKQLAQHLYDTWVAAGKPKKAKSQPEEEQGGQEDPPETAAEAPEQPNTHEEPEKPQDAPEETQQEADERKRDDLRTQFLEMAAERFPDLQEREKWINGKVGPADSVPQWDPKLYVNGIKLLSTDDDDAKMSKETRDALRDALADFPDKKYGSMRDMRFRKFANGAIEGDFLTVGDLTQKEGQLIVWKLEKEKADIELEVEQTKAKLLDDDDTGEPEQKDGAAFIDEKLKEAEATGEITEPFIDVMTEEQKTEWKSLLTKMPERFHNSLGSTPFRDLVKSVIRRNYTSFDQITEGEAEDIIRKMKAVIAEDGGQVERKTPNVA